MRKAPLMRKMKSKKKISEKPNLTKEEENIFIYNYNNYESEESSLS